MPRKAERLELRIETARLAAWKRAAEQSGLPLSEWIRIRCDGTVVQAAAPTIKRAA